MRAHSSHHDSPPLAPGDHYPAIASAAVYAALFGAMGAFYPFFPVWMADRGLSAAEIAMVMAVPLIGRLAVAPLVGRWADGIADRRWLMGGMVALSLALALALPATRGFAATLGVAGAMMVIWQSVTPVVDATVVSLIRRGRLRDYGRIRLWGSLSYAVVASGCGIVLQWGGVDGVLLAFFACLIILLGTVYVLPSGMGRATGAVRARLVLREHRVLLMLFCAVAVLMASQVMLMYFGTIHMLRLGYPQWSVGLLYAVSVAAEIIMFWLGPQALRRFGAFQLLAIAAIGSILRWIGMAFDPPVEVAAVLQLFHAASFSCTYLGIMSLIPAMTEDSVGAQAQSAYVTLAGIIMAATLFGTGLVYQALGGRTYWIAAALATASLLGLMAIRPLLPAHAGGGYLSKAGKV